MAHPGGSPIARREGLFRFARRLARTEDGAAAAELALVTPFLVFLVLNMVDLSRMVWGYAETDSAAQMGARAAYTTCAGGQLPARIHCTGLGTAVTTAVHGTSLGAEVALDGGAPDEAYYCLDGTTLQRVGDYSAPPSPFDCSAVGNSGTAPGDYIEISVSYRYTPWFQGVSLLSTRTITDSAIQRLK